MSYETYKLLHVIGLIALFLGLGGILAGGRKSFLALHGLGLLIMLVAGFGMQAKGSLGFPGWMIAKLGVWVLIAVTPVAMKRGMLPAGLAVLLMFALGGAAAWLALTKPF